MRGSLEPGALIDVLHEIHDTHKTGVLHLIQGDRFRGLRFRLGEIVNGLSSVEGEQMGEVLVRAGLLGAADLERAVAIVHGERKRMGQVLMELGLMDERGLADALARHGREVLLRAFSERGGSYNFEEAESAAAPEQETTLRLTPGEMIFEVARRLEDPEAIRHAVGDLGRVLAPAPDPLLRAQKIALTPGDAFVLSRIDGTSEASEIVELVGLPTEEVLKSLLALLCAGLIRRIAPRKPARRAAVAPAPAPQAEPAPRAPQPAPEPPPPPPPVVEPPPEPAPLDAEAEVRQAEQSLAAAEKLLTEAKYWDAIQALEELIPRVPERMGRRAQLSLARAYRKNPKWAKQAENLLLGVLQAEPRSLEVLLELGNLYEEKGLKSRAVAMYRKAAELDPGHAEAAAAVKRLEPETKGSLTGRFKKIIRRE